MSSGPVSRHVAELLPAFANGTLDTLDTERVRAHLVRCSACRAELADWDALHDAVVYATRSITAPAPNLLDAVWERLGGIEPEATVEGRISQPSRRTFGAWATYVAALVRGQAPLIPRGIWIDSAAAILFGFVVLLLSQNIPHLASFVGFIAPIVTGVSVAFIYGPGTDPGLEVALATPTSPRVVLVSRLALVFGYNACLALAGTLLFMLMRGGDFTLLVSFWLGPMLLLAGLSLLLSLVVSATAGMAVSVGIWFLHLFTAAFTQLNGGSSALSSLLNAPWQTNPAILLLAAALLAAAVIYTPHKTHTGHAG